MKLKPLFAVLLLASTAACVRRETVAYRDPAGVFTAEAGASWRVLAADGARRATFVLPDAAPGLGPESISVLFYAKETPQGKDAAAFAAAHRGSGEPLGPVEKSSVAGVEALRYALRLTEKAGAVREEAAVLSGPKGVVVVLFDAPEASADSARLLFERFLSTLKL